MKTQIIQTDKFINWNNGIDNIKKYSFTNNAISVKIKINKYDQTQFRCEDLWYDCCIIFSLGISSTLQPWF